jgi:AMP-polyphosphate phosphotransferase
MPIELGDFETGPRFSGDVHTQIAELHQRLAAVHRAAIASGKTVILVTGGWVGSGRRALLKTLAGALDPCWVKMWRQHDQRVMHADHILRRYWQHLPEAGEIAVFNGGWYQQLLHVSAAPARALDEINEFEALQTDHGITIVKIFLHISAATQRWRISEDLDHLLVGVDPADLQQLEHRVTLQKAANHMLTVTDTRWAPWTIIDANDAMSGTIAALTAIADQLERVIPLTPPNADPDFIERARAMLDRVANLDS